MMEAEKSSVFRTDIQALRAVAVLVVLIFHVWPDAMPGGYVGVDVFFVISGYLITGVLFREVETGRLDLARFYARRIRRLLPAASVVLVATMCAGFLLLPGGAVRTLAWEVIASGVYVVNWLFVAGSVDYLAGDAAPSAVRHYWSLSIEEQFYFVWPFVMLLAGRVAVQSGFASRSVVSWVLGGIIAGSFAWAVYISFVDPAPGYFLTTTRIWELGVGAMLAVLKLRIDPARGGLCRLAVVAGLAMIVVSALWYDVTLPFPGYEALLPVLGAALVMLAAPGAGAVADRVFGFKPVQYLGDISYSLYLWHWPVLVFYPHVSGGGVFGFFDAFVVIGVSIVAAHFTKLWVEDRFRSAAHPVTGVRYSRASAPTIAVVSTGVVVAVAGGALWATLQKSPSDSMSDADYPGAMVYRLPQRSVPERRILPDPHFASDDRGSAYGVDGGGTQRCIAGWADTAAIGCRYGGQAGRPRVVVVGDSHAVHWLPAFQELSKQVGWQVTGFTKDSCAFTDVMLQYGRRGQPARDYKECDIWRGIVLQEILKMKPDVVVISYSPRHRVSGSSHQDSQSVIAEGTVRLISRLESQGISVAAIKHTPWNGQEIPDCVSRHEDDWSACSSPRRDALRPAALSLTANLSSDVDLLVFDDIFCPVDTCPPVIGNVLVYRDSHHLSATFSRTLWRDLYEKLDDLE